MIYIQIFIFTFYLAYVIHKVGVLPSISDSWYKLGEEFTYFCVALGCTLMFYNSFLLFFSGLSLWFVAIAAPFRGEKWVKIIHYSGAVLAILLALVYLFNQNIYWPIFLILASMLIKKNRIWWVEVTAFYSIIINL